MGPKRDLRVMELWCSVGSRLEVPEHCHKSWSQLQWHVPFGVWTGMPPPAAEVQCDNMAVVQVIAAQASKDRTSMYFNVPAKMYSFFMILSSGQSISQDASTHQPMLLLVIICRFSSRMFLRLSETTHQSHKTVELLTSQQPQ